MVADSMALANLLLIHGAESVLADRALADALVARSAKTLSAPWISKRFAKAIESATTSFLHS